MLNTRDVLQTISKDCCRRRRCSNFCLDEILSTILRESFEAGQPATQRCSISHACRMQRACIMQHASKGPCIRFRVQDAPDWTALHCASGLRMLMLAAPGIQYFGPRAHALHLSACQTTPIDRHRPCRAKPRPPPLLHTYITCRCCD